MSNKTIRYRVGLGLPLAIAALMIGMSALIMVDGVIDWATGSAALFGGINPLFKVWIAFVLILLSATQIRASQDLKNSLRK